MKRIVLIAVILSLVAAIRTAHAIAPPVPPKAQHFIKLGLEGGAYLRSPIDSNTDPGLLLNLSTGWRASHHFMLGGMLNACGPLFDPQNGTANLLFSLSFYPSSYAFLSPLRIEAGLGPAMGAAPGGKIALGGSLLVSVSVPLITPPLDEAWKFYGQDREWFTALGIQVSYQATLLYPGEQAEHAHLITTGLYLEWQQVGER